jgi:GTP-binding protein EngB required for normal cell division
MNFIKVAVYVVIFWSWHSSISEANRLVVLTGISRLSKRLSGNQRMLNIFQLSVDFPGFGYFAGFVRLVAQAF